MFDPTGPDITLVQEVGSRLPASVNPYVIGGAARNALYYQTFGKGLAQRDFDLLALPGDATKFVDFCRRELGFVYGKIRRKSEVVVRKNFVEKPQNITHYVYFDLHISEEADVLTNLRLNSAFTINGFAIPLKSFPKLDKLISLPGAVDDLKNRQLRLNPDGYKFHPGNLFACLRFMSVGYKPPSAEEVELLAKELPKLEKWRFNRNVKKVFTYVGGEANARKLAKRLGVEADIFNLDELRKSI